MIPANGEVLEASPPPKTIPAQPVPVKTESLAVRQRRVAKIGMSAAMTALVATGFMRGRGAKTLHIWSGIALVGLSVWHHHLYNRS